MDAQSTQHATLITPTLASTEKHQMLQQEQQHLVKANQHVIEELRKTEVLTDQLIRMTHLLTIQWEESKEKCK